MRALTAPLILPISGPPIADGVIVLDEDKIDAVGHKAEILARYPNIEVEDFPHCVLMPGLINAHTHLDLLFFQGNGEMPQFFDWVVGSWDHRKRLSPTDRRNCFEEGVHQLLRSGATCVGDTGQYVGVIPQAINGPMRMVLFPEILTGGDASILEHYEAAFAQVDEILACNAPRVTAGIAPYAAYTLSRHLLKIIAQQAHQLKVPIKIHVAETFAEMQFFTDSSGEIADTLFPKMGWSEQIPPEHRKTPIQFLGSIGFLDEAPTLIGCNHLADKDIELLAKSGSKVVHSPRANAHLKLGHPPLRKLLTAGAIVALGTDGTSSLHSLSLWDEMRYVQDHYADADKPSAVELLKMVTLSAAKALGLDRKVGSIEAGKEADVIAVRIPKETTPSDVPSWLVAHATEREIAAIFIQGKRVKT